MGVVPDNAASGTMTEPAPDCSLLPSSSLLLSTIYHSLHVSIPAGYKCHRIGSKEVFLFSAKYAFVWSVQGLF